MRRKVIQHFANMFPQRFLDLPEGSDLVVLAEEAKGLAVFDFLQGTAWIDGVVRPEMRTGAVYRAWLERDAASHGIPMAALLRATMDVRFEVTEMKSRASFGHVFKSATFHFDCTSSVRTDERSYDGHASGSKEWGYGLR